MELIGMSYFKDAAAFQRFKNLLVQGKCDWLLILIDSDVQNYVEQILQRRFTGLNLIKQYNRLATELIAPLRMLRDDQFGEAGKLFAATIKALAKTRYVSQEIGNEAQAELSEAEPDGLQTPAEKKFDLLLNRTEPGLSRLEQAALQFLRFKEVMLDGAEKVIAGAAEPETRDRLFEKRRELSDLQFFTDRGIMQLANRAGLKIIFELKRTGSH